jgi:hypothetical protein
MQIFKEQMFICVQSHAHSLKELNHIGGVMVSMIHLSAVDREFESVRSNQRL